jgi:hypothetical protein
VAGLVIDPSSPASHVSTSDTNTPAAFTPPDDALMLALWAANDSSTDPPAPSMTSSPSRTWFRDVWEHKSSGTPTQQGQAGIWTNVIVGASPGSMTVTIANGRTGTLAESCLGLMVITGHDPVNPVGVVGQDRQLGGTSMSDSYVGSITGGQGFMVVCDWAATDTTGWTAAVGCTILDKATISGQISYATLQRTDPDGINGVPTTLGINNIPSSPSCQLHWAYAEVISLEAAIAAAEQAGYPSLGNSPPMF